MSNKAVRPEDMLPDDVNTAEIAGVHVRKGTVAAVLANATLLESKSASDEEKKQAISMIEELAPAVVAIGLHNHVTWKNKKIQDIFNAAAGLSGSQPVTYDYHHMGIPTKSVQQGEKYSSTFKMYTTAGDNDFSIQWHRFEEGCPLHKLVQTIPHVAFKVNSIDAAIKNRKVILEPYYPFDGFRVAMVEIDGAPVEFIETDLTEEEIWMGSKEGSVIYPKEN